MKKNPFYKKWYTLIEILVGVLIVSMMAISWFYGLHAIGLGKIKLTQKTQLEQEAFYFSERFFELIKSWGTLDYEEYFNRTNVNTSSYLSWHYSTPTWFGNRATEMYYCISGDGLPLPGWVGCMWNILNSSGAVLTGFPLLYGQYLEQFIDYNSDADNDNWDENGDGVILWDDDDAFLWEWPHAFDSSGELKEIYLINKKLHERIFFRWHVQQDSDAPPSAICDFTNQEFPSGNGCKWTIQFLKLKWVDWGQDHVLLSIDSNGTQNDGIIDTWVYDADFYGLAVDTAADLSIIDSESYWLPIVSDDIHVQEIKIFWYPSKDPEESWGDTTLNFVSPYLQIYMKILPSWKNRKGIQWNIPEIEIHSTINLTSGFN